MIPILAVSPMSASPPPQAEVEGEVFDPLLGEAALLPVVAAPAAPPLPPAPPQRYGEPADRRWLPVPVDGVLDAAQGPPPPAPAAVPEAARLPTPAGRVEAGHAPQGVLPASFAVPPPPRSARSAEDAFPPGTPVIFLPDEASGSGKTGSGKTGSGETGSGETGPAPVRGGPAGGVPVAGLSPPPPGDDPPDPVAPAIPPVSGGRGVAALPEPPAIAARPRAPDPAAAALPFPGAPVPSGIAPPVAATAVPTVAAPLPLHAVPLSQLPEAIVSALASGQGLAIDLVPGDLGRVRIELPSTTGPVDVRLVVERADTIPLVQSAVEALTDDLRQAGIQAQTITVELAAPDLAEPPRPEMPRPDPSQLPAGGGPQDRGTGGQGFGHSGREGGARGQPADRPAPMQAQDLPAPTERLDLRL